MIFAMGGVAISAAIFAIWYNHVKTHRVNSCWGPDAIHLLIHAPHVELLELGDVFNTPVDENIRTDKGKVQILTRTSISHAKGLTHLRHALRQDVSYCWDTSVIKNPNWSHGMRFIDGDQQLTLVFDLQIGALQTVESRITLQLNEKMVGGVETYFQELSVNVSTGLPPNES